MEEREYGRLVCLATGSDLAPRARAQLEAIVEDPEPSIEPAQNPTHEMGLSMVLPR
jgi:hypothetical protein